MNPEFILGRPVLNGVSMHLHVEFLIMEAVLEHPKRTLAKIVNNVCCMSKQDVSMLWQAFFKYLKEIVSVSIGLSYFFAPASLSRYAN